MISRCTSKCCIFICLFISILLFYKLDYYNYRKYDVKKMFELKLKSSNQQLRQCKIHTIGDINYINKRITIIRQSFCFLSIFVWEIEIWWSRWIILQRVRQSDDIDWIMCGRGSVKVLIIYNTVTWGKWKKFVTIFRRVKLDFLIIRKSDWRFHLFTVYFNLELMEGKLELVSPGLILLYSGKVSELEL